MSHVTCDLVMSAVPDGESARGCYDHTPTMQPEDHVAETQCSVVQADHQASNPQQKKNDSTIIYYYKIRIQL